MTTDKIPASWIECQLSDLALVIQGQSPPGRTYNTTGRGLPFFQGKAEFRDISPVATKWCSEPKKVAQPGDVLMSIRAPVGPTNLADISCCIGRGLAAMRPLGGIPSRFLLYALRQSVGALTSLATGTTFQAISASQLCSHAVVVPPLNEQRRIVASIETYLTRLDDAVASLERVQRNLKRYRASVLKAAVEGRLVPTEAELARAEGRSYEPASVLLERILVERRRRWEDANSAANWAEEAQLGGEHAGRKYVEPHALDTRALPALPDGWCWASLDQLAVLVRNGLATKPGAAGKVPILRISAVRPLSVDFADIRWLPESAERYERDLLEVGDLLFTRYNGSPSLVGVSGLVRHLPSPTAHPDKLIKVRCVASCLVLAFVELATNTGVSRRFVEGRTRTTAGQAGVSGTDIKKIPVPLPPLAEQHRIAMEADRLLGIEEHSSAAARRELERLGRLRQSILKWAFEGKLVDQDPTDEPASVLLERIKAEREAGVPAEKPKARRRQRPRTRRAPAKSA